MSIKKRVFLIVLDSLGAGEAPDAELFGDVGAHTLQSLYNTGLLRIDNLCSLGIGDVDGLNFLGCNCERRASVARLRELSAGKDTTVGHWELAGHVSLKPLPTFQDGFPSKIIEKVKRISGRNVLCNKSYSGTQVINDYGVESIERDALIVYTSADSVLQIAAHIDSVSLDELYAICKELRCELKGDDEGVGRIIARPFKTDECGKFIRTADRRDFSLEPPKDLLPETVKKNGFDSVSIGKIYDIFSGVGFTEACRTHSNSEGMKALSEYAKKDFSGLCFANLVDFDMLWGHRRDAVAYAKGLNTFDAWLGDFLPLMREHDTLIITADHGCDPSFERSTDHTREYVPYIEYSPFGDKRNHGTVDGFYFVADRVKSILGIQKAKKC